MKVTFFAWSESGMQARKQLWASAGEKSFLRGAHIFFLRPTVLNYAQHIFSGGGVSRVASPPAPPWVQAW